MNRLLTLIAIAALAMSAHAHSYKVGTLTIGHPHTKPTVIGEPAVVRMRITGEGETIGVHKDYWGGDRLVSATVPPEVAESATPHLAGNVELRGLKAPLVAGMKFPMVLRFEKAGEVEVSVSVDAPKHH